MAVSGVKLKDDANAQLRVMHSLASISQLLQVQEQYHLDYNARKILIDFILESYPNMTPEEMVIAVKMNLIGELAPVKLSNGLTADRVEFFQRIDSKYLTSVFLEFQKKKQQAMLAHKAAQEKLKDEEPKEIQSREQAYIFIKKHLEENNGTPPYLANYSGAFEWMYSNDMVIEQEELIKWMKVEKDKLIQKYTNELKLCFNQKERNEVDVKLKDESIKLELRKIYVLNHINGNDQ